MVLTVNPPTCTFPASGGVSTHQLLNPGSERVAFKTTSSNSADYTISPVFGFVKPGSVTIIKITRRAGPAREDRLGIMFTVVTDDARNPETALDACTSAGIVSITMSAILGVTPIPSLTVEPPACTLPASGGSSTHRLFNPGSQRFAFKVRTTNHKQYTVWPAFGFVEPGAAAVVKITRKTGIPGEEKVKVCFYVATANVIDAETTCSTGPQAGTVTITWTATAGFSNINHNPATNPDYVQSQSQNREPPPLVYPDLNLNDSMSQEEDTEHLSEVWNSILRQISSNNATVVAMLISLLGLMTLIIILCLYKSAPPLMVCENMNVELDSKYNISATFLKNQDCVYILHFGSDFTASVNIEIRNLGKTGLASVRNDYGDIVSSESGQLVLSAIFPPPRLYLNIKTDLNQSAVVDITIERLKIHKNRSSVVRTIGEDDQAEVMDLSGLTSWTMYTFNATSQVVLSPLDSVKNPLMTDWISIFVYENNESNTTLVGTLYNTVLEKKFVSSGASLSFCIETTAQVAGTLVINDFENTRRFSQYSASWGLPYFDPRPNAPASRTFSQIFDLDATSGPVAITVYDPVNTLYVEKMWFSTLHSSLSVYSGFPVLHSIQLLIVFYNASTDPVGLPQEFPGRARTFVLDFGKARIWTNVKSYKTKWGVAEIGRSGFLMTSNYRLPSSAQNSNALSLVGENDHTLFSLNLHVDSMFVAPDSTLHVSYYDEGGYHEFSKRLFKMGNETTVLPFYSVSVQIRGSGMRTTGSILNFLIEKGGNIDSVWSVVYLSLMLLIGQNN